jgi:DNA-binding PucR family transcriptional regulator
MAPQRSRFGLRRVLDDLGELFLTLLHGTVDEATPIGGVHIWDPFDRSEPAFRALVLAIGVHTEEELLELVTEVGRQGARALVVRLPLDVSPALAAALDREHLALLGLAKGASWAQLSAVLSTVLAEFDVGEAEPPSLGGPPSGDLFAVANAVAALIDAPVTIEDRHSRVLAFSGRQDETDPARVATILGRRVPDEILPQLRQQGLFDELNRQRQPIYIEPLELQSGERTLPRVAVAVRAGTELLGSIWAVVPGPLDDGRMVAFGDAANLVALHLLRLRAGTDVQRRLQTDLLSTALEGGSGSVEAMIRLGLVGRPALVMALSTPEAAGTSGSPERDAAMAAQRERLSDAFAMHLGALYRRSAVGMIGDVVYAILPLVSASASDLQHATRTARAFIDRSDGAAVIGIGSMANNPRGLTRSRVDADRALRVLLAAREPGRVATVEDVYVDALLLEFDELAASQGTLPVGPVALLVEYDARHRTHLVATLRHWLEAFGDVSLAASAAHVHPNTFRYRLRRLAEIGDIDLDDPNARFAAHLQLRLLALRGALGSPRPSDGR